MNGPSLYPYDSEDLAARVERLRKKIAATSSEEEEMQGTGITNFPTEQLPEYVRTIGVATQMGIVAPGEMFISRRSMDDEFGDTMCSLHRNAKYHRDLGPFWRVMDVVRKKTDTTILDQTIEAVLVDSLEDAGNQ
jgi:hypothetical protein